MIEESVVGRVLGQEEGQSPGSPRSLLSAQSTYSMHHSTSGIGDRGVLNDQPTKRVCCGAGQVTQAPEVQFCHCSAGDESSFSAVFRGY